MKNVGDYSVSYLVELGYFLKLQAVIYAPLLQFHLCYFHEILESAFMRSSVCDIFKEKL